MQTFAIKIIIACDASKAWFTLNLAPNDYDSLKPTLVIMKAMVDTLGGEEKKQFIGLIQEISDQNHGLCFLPIINIVLFGFHAFDFESVYYTALKVQAMAGKNSDCGVSNISMVIIESLIKRVDMSFWNTLKPIIIFPTNYTDLTNYADLINYTDLTNHTDPIYRILGAVAAVMLWYVGILTPKTFLYCSVLFFVYCEPVSPASVIEDLDLSAQEGDEDLSLLIFKALYEEEIRKKMEKSGEI